MKRFLISFFAFFSCLFTLTSCGYNGELEIFYNKLNDSNCSYEINNNSETIIKDGSRRITTELSSTILCDGKKIKETIKGEMYNSSTRQKEKVNMEIFTIKNNQLYKIYVHDLVKNKWDKDPKFNLFIETKSIISSLDYKLYTKIDKGEYKLLDATESNVVVDVKSNNKEAKIKSHTKIKDISMNSDISIKIRNVKINTDKLPDLY